MKTELEIKELLLEKVKDFKHYAKLYKKEKVNKSFNKCMYIASYGSITALLQILNDKNLEIITVKEIATELEKIV